MRRIRVTTATFPSTYLPISFFCFLFSFLSTILQSWHSCFYWCRVINWKSSTTLQCCANSTEHVGVIYHNPDLTASTAPSFLLPTAGQQMHTDTTQTLVAFLKKRVCVCWLWWFTFRMFICLLKRSENSFFLFEPSSSLLASPSSYLQGVMSESNLQVHRYFTLQK